MTSRARRHDRRTTRRHYSWAAVPLVAVAAVAIVYAGYYRSARAPEQANSGGQSPFTFTDARRQAAEFISYHRSIALSREQQQVMDDALSSIPAPCCADYSIATCCCPCNLAKATWGLAKFLIAEARYDTAQVRATVDQWLQFTNPAGYTGNACFTGGCTRSFARNGCGGMDEHDIR